MVRIIIPEQELNELAKEMKKQNRKVTLKDKVLESIKYYEERLDDELQYRNSLTEDMARSDGRIDIIRDIIDDLKEDIKDTEVVDE